MSSPKTRDGHLLAAGGQAAPSGLRIFLFPTQVQLGTELRFHNRQRRCWGYTRSKENGAGTWEPNCISQANPNPKIHLHNPEGKVILGQVALLIKKTSSNISRKDFRQTARVRQSHTTQKQHSMQMCTNKIRSLATQSPDTTALWLSSEVPPGTASILPPSTTAAQCFGKPSWADHPLPCPRSGQATHWPPCMDPLCSRSRPHCWVH